MIETIAFFILGGMFGLGCGFVVGFNMGYDFFNEEEEKK